MKVVILAGGMGTRLRPLTFSIPKPLLPVGEKPILETILSRLRSHSLTDIIITVGYKSELIKTYFGDGSKFGVDIQYSEESKRSGTAGPLRLVKDRFNINEPLLVMNGDIITKLNFKEMIDFHIKNNVDLTVGIKEHKSQTPYGIIELNGNRIKEIKEKPESKFNISTGIYIINPSVLELIPKNEFYNMPDLIEKSIELGKRVFGFFIKEYWSAIEYLDDLNRANKKLTDGQVDI